MRTNDLLLVLGLGGLAYYAYTRYAMAGGLQFVPLGVSTGGNGLIATIGVQNPSGTSAVLSSFAGSLKLNGSTVAAVSNFQGITIQPNAQTQLQFNVTPNLIGLGANLLDIAQNGLDDYSVSLSGTANVNNTPVPVNINF